MKLDQNIANLIYDLEYEIGDCCYNPNSYDGRTGEYGKWYRYPLSIKALPEEAEFYKDGIEKTSYRVSDREPEYVETMRYVFGTNQLRIGDGIINLLKELERRYKIDFNKLEEEYLDQYPEDLQFAKALLENSLVECCNDTGLVKKVYLEDKHILFNITYKNGLVITRQYPRDLLEEKVIIVEQFVTTIDSI